MTNVAYIAIAASIAAIAASVSAIAEGLVCVHAIDGVSRNPEMYSKVRTMMVLGCALCETTAIYSLLIAILLIFVLK